MSVLHKAATIYADFENVIANTDLFVCKKLYQLLKDSEHTADHPIHGFFDVIKATGEEYIPEFTLQKKTHNPLRELADPTKIIQPKLKDPRKELDLICDELYDTVLSFHYEEEPLGTFPMTNIADSIRALLKDSQLKDVYIYVKNISPPIHAAIYAQFNESNKVKIVTGDRRKFFDEKTCDMYIFNSLKDIELMQPVIGKDEDIKKTPKIDISFLDTEYNLDLWNNYFIDKKDDHTSVSRKYNAEFSIIKRTI